MNEAAGVRGRGAVERSAHGCPHPIAHEQGPEVQERVLRHGAQPFALDAVGAVDAAVGAAIRRRLRGERARELLARAVELVLHVRLAHVGHRTQHRRVEPVDIAQEQHVAVGRAQRDEDGVDGQLHAVADGAEVVRAGARRPAPRELVEALLAHERVQPFLRLRRLDVVLELPPAGRERRDQAAFAVAEAPEHAGRVGEERRLVARRERDVRLVVAAESPPHELVVAPPRRATACGAGPSAP